MARRNQGPRLRWLEKRGAFYIFWTENGRSRERSTGTTDSKQAEIVFTDFLAARQRHAGPCDPSAILISDILNIYAEERAPKVASSERIGYALTPLLDFFEGRTAGEITEHLCEQYADWRGKSPGTTGRELSTLRAALNYAHRHNRLTRPMHVWLPDAPPPKDRWLTRTEAAALLRAARSERKSRLHLPLFILIGLYTGKRKEAILSLRWTQVDLDRGVIDWELPGRRITKKRRGRNPINPKLLAHLRRAQLRGSDLGSVIEYEGKPIGNVKKAFAGACARAGLEDVTPHTLRHSCATWLMQAGVEPWQAAGFLGMTVETLTKVYGHHHPDYQRAAANAI